MQNSIVDFFSILAKTGKAASICASAVNLEGKKRRDQKGLSKNEHSAQMVAEIESLTKQVKVLKVVQDKADNVSAELEGYK